MFERVVAEIIIIHSLIVHAGTYCINTLSVSTQDSVLSGRDDLNVNSPKPSTVSIYTRTRRWIEEGRHDGGGWDDPWG